MPTIELAQEFAVTVRGYDRAQVDSYVDTLREWLGNATFRMEASEAENSALREQVVMLRTRVAQLEQQVTDNPPRTIEALGDRVCRILILAEEGAVAVTADAEAEAVAILGRARHEADDLQKTAKARHAEAEAFVAGASQQAASLVQQAEARAVEAAARLRIEAESWAKACEADAETRATAREAEAATREVEAAQRAAALVTEAESERDRVMLRLAQEKVGIGNELRRLAAERDDAREGLTRLKESLHRTIVEMESGAERPVVAGVIRNSAAPPPGQPAK